MLSLEMPDVDRETALPLWFISARFNMRPARNHVCSDPEADIGQARSLRPHGANKRLMQAGSNAVDCDHKPRIREQDYFAEGIAEGIMTALSRMQ
jgi:hypothetical protein